MKKLFICIIIAAAALALPANIAACTHKPDRTAYSITAAYDDESGTLTAECAVDYYNGGEDTKVIKFNLYGNAYRKGALYKPVSDEFASRAYYGGASYGAMEIKDVSGAESWQVCGEDSNILEVTLPENLKSGGRAQVSIDYTLELADINHRTGITRHTVNLGNFYPIACVRSGEGFVEEPYYSDGDPFISDCADYMVEITVPEGYTVAAGGTCERQGNTARCTLENARDFAMVLSDEFKKAECDANGTAVTYYYYNDDNAEAALGAAAQSLLYFEKKFGEYQYPSYTVVQTGFAAGGMEYPAFAMISDGLEPADAIYATVHETAHQWWYAMAGSDQINNAWQDEGLAEYSALCFFEEHPDYGFTRTGLINSATEAYRAYYSVYNQIFGDADTTMSRHLKDFVSDYEYVNIAYNKGLIMFDSLRTSIGDDRFFKGLKNYFERANGKIATPEQLIESFTATGVDIAGFFDSFLEGKIII